MRITGSGNFIVYPDRRRTEAHDGSRVIVLTSSINPVQVSLEVIRDRISEPYRSDLTLIVGARRRVERCNAWCNGRRLSAEDSMGTPQTELPLPIGGYLYFRIPEETPVEAETVLEVRDGDVVLRREKFGRIVGASDTYESGLDNLGLRPTGTPR